MDGKGSENLLDVEKIFHDKVKEIMNFQRRGVLDNLLNGRIPDVSEPKGIKSDIENKILVRFISPVPKFKGENGFIYGPFEEHDVANLPKELVDLLLKKGRAQMI